MGNTISSCCFRHESKPNELVKVPNELCLEEPIVELLPKPNELLHNEGNELPNNELFINEPNDQELILKEANQFLLKEPLKNLKTCKNVSDLLEYLTLKRMMRQEFSQNLLIANFLIFSTYTHKILLNEFRLECILIVVSEMQNRLGIYNGWYLTINQHIYESEGLEDVLSAFRNLTHELLHIYSDFAELFQRPGINLEGSDILTRRFSKKQIEKKYQKQGIGIANAMKLVPMASLAVVSHMIFSRVMAYHATASRPLTSCNHASCVPASCVQATSCAQTTSCS